MARKALLIEPSLDEGAFDIIAERFYGLVGEVDHLRCLIASSEATGVAMEFRRRGIEIYRVAWDAQDQAYKLYGESGEIGVIANELELAAYGWRPSQKVVRDHNGKKKFITVCDCGVCDICVG